MDINHYSIKYAALVIGCSIYPLVCFGQQRSKEAAIDVAKEFCFNQMSSIRIINSKTKGSSEIKGRMLSTQSKDAFYVFQGQEKGFVIVSGDERMPHVLAYSDDSQFDIDSIPPSVKYWLDCYEECYLQLNFNDNTPDAKLTADVNPEGVSPLLDKIQWGQGDPYNRQCPNYSGERTLTGCVATAMAQVMKYHEYPQKGNGICNYYTVSNRLHVVRDLSKYEFDWPSMLPDYKHSYNSTNANAVAALMASCGASVSMDYGTSSQGGSGAYQTDLLKAYVQNFNYDPDAAVLIRSYCSTQDWHDLLIRELNEGRPVNYAGHSTRDGGHSFVLDGYRIRNGMQYPDYHVNWGWNGSCDGYFQIADLHPEYTYDGFTSSQQMTIGIKPNDHVDEYFTCLCTEKLKTTKSNCKPGDKIRISTSSLCNFGYHQFNGTIQVNLLSNENNILELARTKRISLKSLEDYPNLNIDVALPDDLQKGNYTFELSYVDEKGNRSKIYSKSYPQIAVSADGNSPIPPSYVSSTLGCSEVQFLNNKNDSTEIRVNIYELVNLEVAPFIGDVRLLISDKKGLGYTALGDSIAVSEIGQYDVAAGHIAMKCKITGDWPDGQYRMCVGARPFGSLEYLPVSHYDYTEPMPVAVEHYFDAVIKNGKLTVSGQVYNIERECVTIDDITYLISAYLLMDSSTNIQKYDFDKDGKITISDIVELVSMYLKQ